MHNGINEWDRMVAGKLYNADSADIAQQHAQGFERCERFNQISVTKPEERQKALEELIPSAKGKGLAVYAPFYCEYGVNIHVGEGCFVNFRGTFLDVAPITLGNKVWIGANVTIATPMHPFLAEERTNLDYPDGRHDLEYASPITIGDGCWICSSATICGGVTIGENTIVAAGAVVTKDMPANCLVGGVPARVIRPLDEKDRMHSWETYEKNEMPLSDRDREKER